MPLLPLRWFLVLVGVFLVSLCADLYLSRPDADPAAAAAAEQLNAADFLSAAAAGQLSAGTITYRTNAAALADLAATRSPHDRIAAAAVKATARISDADLAVLRKNHFTEDDVAAMALVHVATWRERSAAIAHTSMQILAIITAVAAVLMGAALYAARFTSLSVRQMRAATSRVKFSAVAGCHGNPVCAQDRARGERRKRRAAAGREA